MSLFQKLTAINSKPNSTTFPGLVDVVIWARCILAIMYGTYLGWTVTKGAVGILMGLNFVTFFPILYCTYYLGADVDTFHNLLFAGVPNAVALMILIWVFFYTMEFSDDEEKFAAALMMVQKMQSNETGNSDSIGLGDEAAEADTISAPIEEEQEF